MLRVLVFGAFAQERQEADSVFVAVSDLEEERRKREI